MIDAARRFVRRLKRGRTADGGDEPSQRSLRVEPLESERGFRLDGDLDVFSVDGVRKTLEHELHGRLVLDLAAVDFMDDSGLGCLLQVVKRLRELGGSLVLRNLNDQIRRTFEITGLSTLPGLTIEQEDGDAVAD